MATGSSTLKYVAGMRTFRYFGTTQVRYTTFRLSTT